jgi:hypothetical protein
LGAINCLESLILSVSGSLSSLFSPLRELSRLNRASWVQEQVQQRLDEVKYQAQRQVEETRKAAASAAWWLFATALTSAILSTLAGGLAVVR